MAKYPKNQRNKNKEVEIELIQFIIVVGLQSKRREVKMKKLLPLDTLTILGFLSFFMKVYFNECEGKTVQAK